MEQMTKPVKAKTFETWALFKSLEQKNDGKYKKKPFSRFILDMPLIEQKQFTELCVNEGYRLSVKVEYLPKKTKKESRQD